LIYASCTEIFIQQAYGATQLSLLPEYQLEKLIAQAIVCAFLPVYFIFRLFIREWSNIIARFFFCLLYIFSHQFKSKGKKREKMIIKTNKFFITVAVKFCKTR